MKISIQKKIFIAISYPFYLSKKKEYQQKLLLNYIQTIHGVVQNHFLIYAILYVVKH